MKSREELKTEIEGYLEDLENMSNGPESLPALACGEIRDRLEQLFNTRTPEQEECLECGGRGRQFECDPEDERELVTPTVQCPSCGGSGKQADCINKSSSDNDGWISVEDRFPKRDYKRYLCCNVDGVFVSLFREYSYGWDFESDYGNPTHWRPLPKPPESLGGEIG